MAKYYDELGNKTHLDPIMVSPTNSAHKHKDFDDDKDDSPMSAHANNLGGKRPTSGGLDLKSSTLPLESAGIVISQKETLDSFSPTESVPSNSEDPKSRLWGARLIQLGPLAGVFGLFIALGSIFASLGVLVGSDGKPVASWPVQPSIFLAAFTAVANLSIRFACIQGVVIAWWVGES
jgi:hypothetical protein